MDTKSRLTVLSFTHFSDQASSYSLFSVLVLKIEYNCMRLLTAQKLGAPLAG